MDDAPLRIGAPAKPKITRKPDGTFVMKMPDGTEKPLPKEKLPAALRAKIEQQEQMRRQAAQQRMAQSRPQPNIKRRKLKINNDDRPKRKKRAKSVAASSGLRYGDRSEPDSEDDAAAQRKMASMRQNRSGKDELIANFLCRWWYVWPEYPPTNHNYDSALSNAKLREVDIEMWEDEKKIQGGLKKCYQLKTFPGLFRDCDQQLHDLRPNHNKPSYNYLNAMSQQEVAKLLVQAYENQLVELKKSPYLRIMPTHVHTIQQSIDRVKQRNGIRG